MTKTVSSTKTVLATSTTYSCKFLSIATGHIANRGSLAVEKPITIPGLKFEVKIA